MSYVFEREPLAGLLESGLERLIRDHWVEVSHDRGVINLNPDFDEYAVQEQKHRFVCFGLRKDGNLVGYNAFFVVHSIHYRDHIFAVNDAIFLDKSERGVQGIAMIVEAEKALKKLDVTKVFYHTKADAILGRESEDSLGAIDDLQQVEAELDLKLPDAVYSADRTLGAVLEALGYRHIENHYGKLLRSV